MSTIPIVQGVAVQHPASDSKYQASYHTVVEDAETGGATAAGWVAPAEHLMPAQALSQQELEQLRQHPLQQYQDVLWAIAFVLHLVAILCVIVLNLLDASSTTTFASAAGGSIILLTCVTGASALVLSACALQFMMTYAEGLVQVALIFSVITSLCIGILGFMMGSLLMGILGIVSFVIGLCYAKIVWPRIPFAAANLKTALSAVQSNMGLNAVSFSLTLVALGWTLLWFMGVGNALSTSNAAILFSLFLSYYWVHQVLQNTMHVTTAGVVGTWWFVPEEANSFWSSALSGSFFRATTYSFGSICFGSFLVAIVQALRALEYHSRSSDDMQFLSCIIQCILACIQDIIEFLNRWAYVYVGLYGFSYLEAGRNVVELFKARGWTTLITDDLADNVLFMISVAIGLASGLVGLVLGLINPDMFVDLGFENSVGPAFVVGMLSGFLFASIIMSVVASAVNTVIVCFAEDPASFERNHPELSTEMRAAWVQAWPGLI